MNILVGKNDLSRWFFIAPADLFSHSLNFFYYIWTSRSYHPDFHLLGFLAHNYSVHHRISTETASLSGQQHVGLLQKKRSNDCLYPQINVMPDEMSGDNNQNSIRWLLLPSKMLSCNIYVYIVRAPYVKFREPWKC